MTSIEIQSLFRHLEENIENVIVKKESKNTYNIYSINPEYKLGYINKNTQKNGGVFCYHFNSHQWHTKQSKGANNANPDKYTYGKDSECLKQEFCKIYQCSVDHIEILPGTAPKDKEKCYVLVKDIKTALAIIESQLSRLPKH